MKVIQAVKFVVIRTYKAAGSLLILYAALTVFVSLLSIFNMLVFKEVIDAANGQKTLLGLSIFSLIVFWIIYAIVNKIVEKLAEYLWNIIDLKQTIYNTGEFVNKLSTLDLSNFESPQTYDKIWRSFNRIPWQLKYYLDLAIKLLGKTVELSISILIFFIASPLNAALIILANIIPVLFKSKLR